MKHALMVLVAAVAMVSSTGCLGLHNKCGCGNGQCSTGHCGAGCRGCHKCGHHGTHGGLQGRRSDREYAAGPQTEAGPPVGAVSYPYYTTRGPRDFLINNPPSIGR